MILYMCRLRLCCTFSTIAYEIVDVIFGCVCISRHVLTQAVINDGAFPFWTAKRCVFVFQ